jgi:hypothetical protein
MNEIIAILLGWKFLVLFVFVISVVFIKYIIFKYKMLVHQLSKGFLGLTSSRKGVLSLLLFLGSQLPMTVLCFLGKIDGTAYGICVSAVTTAVVAIFCHTQSKTDQMLGTSQFPLPSSTIDTVINAAGNMTQNMSGPGITANVTPIINNPPTT